MLGQASVAWFPCLGIEKDSGANVVDRTCVVLCELHAVFQQPAQVGPRELYFLSQLA